MKKFKFILVLFLVLLLFTPIVASNVIAKDSIIRLNQQVSLYWDTVDEKDPIIPRDDLKKLNVTFEYSFDHGLSFSEGLYLNYVNYKDFEFTQTKHSPEGAYSKAKIDLEILDMPSWCHATFRHAQAIANLSSLFVGKIPLYIILDDDAPAYEQGYIQVKAKIRSPPAISYFNVFEKVFNLTFTPSYYPIIDVNLPEVNVKEIEPYETAIFPLDISNLGNDKTIVTLEVENLPNDWKATVTDSIIIEKNSSKKAQLSIKPPRNFGYTDEVGILRLKVTPKRAYDTSQIGDSLTISFLIKNKGVSVEGDGLFSAISMIIIVIIIFLVAGLYIRKKIKSKT